MAVFFQQQMTAERHTIALVERSLHRRNGDNLRFDHAVGGPGFRKSGAQIRGEARQPLLSIGDVVSAQPHVRQPRLQGRCSRVEPGYRFEVDQVLYQRELRNPLLNL
ncbi:Uncharacterised protein [Serratia plymuthica]|uniref:Uncharacterized protein n=1 Tax=Serratia plymuthica TaxID=82996 RepID=A0A2X4UNW9_SERPL|nr:Uncharacterised protein [Serratia plymuthica]